MCAEAVCDIRLALWLDRCLCDRGATLRYATRERGRLMAEMTTSERDDFLSEVRVGVLAIERDDKVLCALRCGTGIHLKSASR